MRWFPRGIRSREGGRSGLNLPHDEFDSIAPNGIHWLRAEELVAGIGGLQEPGVSTGCDITKGVQIGHWWLGGGLIPFGPDKTGIGGPHNNE